MDKPDYLQHPFTPNNGELPPKSEYQFALDRRNFFKITGGGLIVAFLVKDIVSFANSNDPADIFPLQAGNVDAWIHIAEDGTLNVFTGKVEVGQSIRIAHRRIGEYLELGPTCRAGRASCETTSRADWRGWATKAWSPT